MAMDFEFLSQEEIDQIYAQHLKECEAMQLRAFLVQRVHNRYGQGMWDPDTGADFIAEVRAEASMCQPKPGGEEEG